MSLCVPWCVASEDGQGARLLSHDLVQDESPEVGMSFKGDRSTLGAGSQQVAEEWTLTIPNATMTSCQQMSEMKLYSSGAHLEAFK
jgi:hypothetical protein